MEKQHITNNKVKVFSYAMPNLHSFCLSLNIKAGKMYEETAGITHLLEHMFFRRLDDLSQNELYRELDKYGLYLNGCTYKEFIYFDLIGNIKFFKEACKIFVKLLAPPSFTSADLKLEQKRICRELEEGNERDSTEHLSNINVWRGTSLERYSTPSSMKKISLIKLKEEREKAFTAENIFFYVTGAVSEENLSYLYELIENYNVPSNSIIRDNVMQQPVDFFNRKPDIWIKKSHWNYILFSFDYNALKYDPHEIDLLYDILFTGNSAIFNYVLSEQEGLIYESDARIERYKNIGRCYFSYEIASEDLYHSLKSSVAVLRGIKNEISDFDFNRVRLKHLESTTLMDNVSETNWNMSYDNHILSYGYTDLDSFSKLYEKVTKERLMTIAKEIFCTKNLSVAIRTVNKLDIDLIKEIVSEI